MSKSHQDVHLAVIVPFRDQPLQNRREQLQRFVAHMTTFLKGVVASFHILLMEQTHDGYKFNRGKALNAGFVGASSSERTTRYELPAGPPFTAYCFHDVDLLPGPPLAPWYGKDPADHPIHIGAAWLRYPYPNYVGGILTLSPQQIVATNGFPNNFWGWGGEDDELSKRLQETRTTLVKPGANIAKQANAIVDLEEVLIGEKGGERAGTGLKSGGRTGWRDMLKREKLALHTATWKHNGVNSVDFTVKTIRHLSPHVTLFTVDLHGEADKDAQPEPK